MSKANSAPQLSLVTPPSSLPKKRKDEQVNDEDHDDRKRPRQLDMGGCKKDQKDDEPNSVAHVLFDHGSFDEDKQDDSDSDPLNSARRQIMKTYSQELTQPTDYSPDITAGFSKKESTHPPLLGILEDYNSEGKRMEIRSTTYTLGRSSNCDVVILDNTCISRNHCSILFQADGSCSLQCLSAFGCWIEEQDKQGNIQLKRIGKDEQARIYTGCRFRLMAPGGDEYKPGVEYKIHCIAKEEGQQQAVNPGSHSFDVQYLKLLQSIQSDGIWKHNTKGSNCTLSSAFTLNVDLYDSSGKDRNLLPLTSLRNLYGGRGALVEALWYLRGEDDATFLQRNKCAFWDKQAIDKDSKPSWVGLNYGLLTHFPGTPGQSPINQLEQNVISRLLKEGSCSRNMICSLGKPGEDTVQEACTACVQFSVSLLPNKNTESEEQLEEALDLTVTQRSSDVMVGLPHDVVVWSIILHLVRREVWIRSRRKLLAGKLSFTINQNAAHVYQVNHQEMLEILQRKPIPDCQPHLVIDGEETQDGGTMNERSMFEFAKSYDDANIKKLFRIKDYTKNVHHPAIKLSQAM